MIYRRAMKATTRATRPPTAGLTADPMLVAGGTVYCGPDGVEAEGAEYEGATGLLDEETTGGTVYEVAMVVGQCAPPGQLGMVSVEYVTTGGTEDE